MSHSGIGRHILENTVVNYCGTTARITSEDFSSCMMAWTSFVFAILTGVCIGAISLSTIIGIAYVNKKARLATLVLLATFFEAVGMLTMSRFTLDLTVKNTIPISSITNLRLGFIVLGTT
mmetsp:Transcript_45185/g.59931  ORF Transcript_45185/g.59931 Transcript_45185/m.59931 type:complete len:120 (+) Transcript_45185:36-395(+)